MTKTSVGRDYPKWGIWPTGYFQTLNIPTGVCAYDSSKLNGGNALQICVELDNGESQAYQDDYTLVPADVDSNTAPPAGQDEFFIGSMGQTKAGQPGGADCYDGNGSCTNLYLYSMHPNFTGTGSTFTGSGLNNPIPVPAYTLLCPTLNFPHGNCIPQTGTMVGVQSLPHYTMYRFAYWNDGSTQHWFVNHVVQASQLQAGVRWYEFRAPAGVATLSSVTRYQSATFAPNSNHRWMGSIARDNSGDIALGYSESSTNTHPAIYITGQVPGSTMQQEIEVNPGNLDPGTSSQNWGDYSTMSIDPEDGCTFWYTSEYYGSDSLWHTQLTKFQFPRCTPY
jgi:hypothetical protein